MNLSPEHIKILWQAINESSDCNNCYTIDTINKVLLQYFTGVQSGSLPKYNSASNSADVANKLTVSTGETSGRIQKILFYMEKLGNEGKITLPIIREEIIFGLTFTELLIGAGLGFVLWYMLND